MSGEVWGWVMVVLSTVLLAQTLSVSRRRRRFRDPTSRDAEIDRVIEALGDSVMAFGEVTRDLEEQERKAKQARREVEHLRSLVEQTEPEVEAVRWALARELRRGWKQSLYIGLLTNALVGALFFAIGRLTA
jgi:uncharacterized membrane protein